MNKPLTACHMKKNATTIAKCPTQLQSRLGFCRCQPFDQRHFRRTGFRFALRCFAGFAFRYLRFFRRAPEAPALVLFARLPFLLTLRILQALQVELRAPLTRRGLFVLRVARSAGSSRRSRRASPHCSKSRVDLFIVWVCREWRARCCGRGRCGRRDRRLPHFRNHLMCGTSSSRKRPFGIPGGAGALGGGGGSGGSNSSTRAGGKFNWKQSRPSSPGNYRPPLRLLQARAPQAARQ